MSSRSACDIEIPDVPLAQFDELEILDDANLERCILPKSTLGNRPRNQQTPRKIAAEMDKSSSSASNSIISTSLQDLVESFDKNVSGVLKDMNKCTEQIAPVKIRSQEEIMNESQFWWTLTGNYGSLPPIDFHQSVIRRNQMAALDLKVPKQRNHDGTTPTGPSSLSDTDSGEDDDSEDKSDTQRLDFHAAAASIGSDALPPVNADRVIEEIDDIIQAGDLMTRSLINTPRTLESFDSMYSSMRSPNNCIDAEQIFNARQQIKSSELAPISAEEISRYSQSKLITIVSEIEQIIQLYNEELVNELARRDELDYAKEVRNQFITLLIDVQEKRRKAGSLKKQKQKETKSASKNNLCSVKIPYDNSQEVPDIRVLESLNKILQAMCDGSDQFSSLLTDYILNVICPSKITNLEG
ncbi:hypothetical protein ACQ4LE_006921 [Meloidogyne hapla]|uniref:Fasciculation and elongation protein zeta-2 n=1 Tax=Meloidogyne hapla TaxID=6305 RepID=A0A1I8B132_MELHA